MGFLDVTRRVVVRTNRWPGVGVIYERAYDLGLRFSAARLAAVPGVLAVLQRVNTGGDRWSPGLSDYDLTIVTAPHDPAGAVRFLGELWTRHRSIRRWAPPLGQLDIVDVDEYADLVDFGPMPTWSLKCARPLVVTTDDADVARLVARTGRVPEPQDFLLDAIERFARYFIPAWLDDVEQRTDLTRRRAEHLLANVVKRLERLGIDIEPARASPLTARAAALILAMTRACRQIAPASPARPAAVDPNVVRLPDEVAGPMHRYSARVLEDVAALGVAAVAWVSYMTADRLTLNFVVPDDLGRADLVHVLDAIARRHSLVADLFRNLPAAPNGARYIPAGVPVVSTMSMWRCWRQLSPFDSLAMAASGRVLLGDDPGGATPSFEALRCGAGSRYTVLLSAKSNWQSAGSRGGLYSSVVNHANGCVSVFGERAATAPTVMTFASIEDGYAAASTALAHVRTVLKGRVG